MNKDLNGDTCFSICSSNTDNKSNTDTDTLHSLTSHILSRSLARSLGFLINLRSKESPAAIESIAIERVIAAQISRSQLPTTPSTQMMPEILLFLSISNFRALSLTGSSSTNYSLPLTQKCIISEIISRLISLYHSLHLELSLCQSLYLLQLSSYLPLHRFPH